MRYTSPIASLGVPGLTTGLRRTRRTAPLTRRVRFMKLVLLLITVVGIAVHDVNADSPRTPFPYIVTASNGIVYFRMFPRPRPGNWSDGYGIAYRIRDNGSDVEMWRTRGWFSTEVFLSNDGGFLVAMGPWNGGSEPRNEDLALAFYREGKVIKQYSTADLVKDKSKVMKTLSHYDWLARDAELKNRIGKEIQKQNFEYCRTTYFD